MKIQTIIRTATPAVISAAAILLSFRFPVKADSLLVAYGCVAALGVLLSVEYNLPWRRLFGR